MFNNNNMKEKIFGKTRYLVSESGVVIKSDTGRVLAQKTDRDGYKSVTLIDGPNRKYQRVHRLVAELYLEKSEKPQVNHIDGVKDNNHWSNLEWCTASENEIHARTFLGKNNFGDKSSRKKINKEIANSIRFEFKQSKVSQQQLAIKYNISQTQVGRVLRGEVWN